VEKSLGLFSIGVLIGLSPCAPLIGALLEIADSTSNIWQGALYGFVFGLGTGLPLLILGGLSAMIGNLSYSCGNFKIGKLFRIACGILLIFVGIGKLISLWGLN
jgi:sulfite exporter TauE/SafE